MKSARYGAQLRAEVKGNTVRGHAAVFNLMARLPGQYEQLASTAFDAALADGNTDTRSLINHDPNLLLGRLSAGTLHLSVDSEGLEFENELPNTTYANDLRESLERGDIDGCSFQFIPGKDEWDRAPDGVSRQTHTSIRQLIDVSIVTFPAYDGTDVMLRSYQFSSSSKSRLIKARHRVLIGTIEGSLLETK